MDAQVLKGMRIEGEIDGLEYHRRKEAISADIAAAETRLGALPNGQSSHDLLLRIDQVAEVIAGGTLRQQKEVMNALFEKVEQRDGQIQTYMLESWARGVI
jgi:hypothetical protein